jgi:predicted metal-dependent hydrolase
VQLDLPFLRTPDSVRPAEPPPAPRIVPPIDPPDSTIFVRVRSARRYILRVRPDGTLRVTVPRGGSRREAQAFVEQNHRWVERERRRVREQHGPREWQDGSELMLRGEMMPVRLSESDGVRVATYGDRVTALRDGESVRSGIERDLRDLAKRELEPRLRELARENGLDPGAVSIRNQRSRWGSCSREGHIALNFRLVQMPPEVRDYILLHELMHIRQQNHSRRFWRLVEAVCPAFRDAERWLRTTGRALF